MTSEKQNIIIADTQILITESLKALLKDSTNYKVLAITDNVEDLKKLLDRQETSLLITDFTLFDEEGANGLLQLNTDFPKTRILILTNYINRNELKELDLLGIKNIIYKTTSIEELFLCIDAAIKNRKYYCSDVLDLLMDNKEKNEVSETLRLTPTEIETVKLIANGLTTKEIAEKKHVSFHTVVSHRKNIFRKLNINNASELVMFAVRTGIISDNIDYYI